MNIEIDYETAQKLAGDVLIQNYTSLQGEVFYDGAGSLESLLEAFKLVIEYSTTEQQRDAYAAY